MVYYSGNVGNLTIGRRSYANSGFFRGLIDEVGLFNAALTSSQIEGIYNATALVDGVVKTADLSVLTTPPIKWYRMGD